MRTGRTGRRESALRGRLAEGNKDEVNFLRIALNCVDLAEAIDRFIGLEEFSKLADG